MGWLKLLLEYFMSKLKKEEEVIELSKVMKEEKKNFEETHES